MGLSSNKAVKEALKQEHRLDGSHTRQSLSDNLIIAHLEASPFCSQNQIVLPWLF